MRVSSVIGHVVAILILLALLIWDVMALIEAAQR